MKSYISAIIAAVMMFSSCAEQGGDYNEIYDQEPCTESENAYDAKDQAREILSDMTLEEKVLQMMFVAPEAITGEKNVTSMESSARMALQRYPVGGIIYFSDNIKSREQITAMIEDAQRCSKIPLFIGVDEEGGRVRRLGSQKSMGMTQIPPMGTVTSSDEAYEIGKTLAKELSDLLFNVDFAPVADVLVYENNTEIGDRSFGKDASEVAEMVNSIVSGMEDGGISSVMKHFPGHGSTKTNSHTGYSESKRSIDELRACEFLPFKGGIEAGCDIILVSHMTLVNAMEEKMPSSLSREVIEGFLKGELGFEGIVISDSLSMGAITKEFTTAEAAVLAVIAGCDMLLMPKDIEQAKNAVIEAVEAGNITNEMIDESVEKILRIKIEKGLYGYEEQDS